jgi:hypothetical protein
MSVKELCYKYLASLLFLFSKVNDFFLDQNSGFNPFHLQLDRFTLVLQLHGFLWQIHSERTQVV